MHPVAPLRRRPAGRAVAVPSAARAHRPSARAVLGLALSLALACVLALPTVRADDVDGPMPSRELTPEQVVAIVIDALRTNAESDDDAGIATVYRFASPGNRANTGPLERFTRMIKRGFADMLAHESRRHEEMRVVEDKALQAVWLTLPSGTEVGYAFQLGRQKDGEYEGMWMTESVLPLGVGERSGTRI